MFNGDIINVTEQRAALHTALRAPKGEKILLDGVDVAAEVHAVLDRTAIFSEQVRSGQWLGYTGKRIANIVNIGIGGSDLGPVMAYEALRHYSRRDLTFRFVSNVDGTDFTEATRDLDPEETLFIVCSKTFTTLETLTKSHQWLANPVRRLEDFLGTIFAVPLTKRGLRRAGSLIPPHLHAPAIHYARHRRKAMRFLSEGSQTLVHHDCHPGNLFWHKSKPGFLDWQLVRAGEGISDVAYFLATALTPEIRRLHEATLISVYVRILMDNGVAGIDLASQLQRYRAHLIYPLEAMLVTLAIGGIMDLESNLELIRRTAAAVEDLDAFAVMPTCS